MSYGMVAWWRSCGLVVRGSAGGKPGWPGPGDITGPGCQGNPNARSVASGGLGRQGRFRGPTRGAAHCPAGGWGRLATDGGGISPPLKNTFTGSALRSGLRCFSRQARCLPRQSRLGGGGCIREDRSASSLAKPGKTELEVPRMSGVCRRFSWDCSERTGRMPLGWGLPDAAAAFQARWHGTAL